MLKRTAMTLQEMMIRSACEAGLRHSCDEEPGYRRRRCGRGFTYLNAAGERVRDPALRDRFASLAIPPAWHDVWICKDPNGHLLVTGRDNVGRKQYIYHPRWASHRARVKCSRLLDLGAGLPALRDRVDQDLRRRHVDRERCCALAVALLDRLWMRIGHDAYTEANGSRGLTTLRVVDARLTSRRALFEYTAKSGVERALELRDRRLARQLRRVAALPGERLLCYRPHPHADPVPLRASDVNDYLARHLGHDLHAKDFRTWGGSVAACRALLSQPPPDGDAALRACLDHAFQHASEVLGNTPAVARDHYIHLDLLDAAKRGDLWSLQPCCDDLDARLNDDERRFIAVLRALC